MIINKENLEKILVTNWTQFVDIKLLRTFVQTEVSKNLNSFISIPVKRNKINANNISISRFYSFNNGYIIWIEFILYIENKIVEGTIEAFTSEDDGAIKTISKNGNVYFT
jgi:hypothetical protein